MTDDLGGMYTDGWRLYLLLALFDRRDGTPLADLVHVAREGYERSHLSMGEPNAWDHFDSLWNFYTSEERIALVSFSGYRAEIDRLQRSLTAVERVNAENDRLRQAMREAMKATGTGTLHYHILRDALEATASELQTEGHDD